MKLTLSALSLLTILYVFVHRENKSEPLVKPTQVVVTSDSSPLTPSLFPIVSQASIHSSAINRTVKPASKFACTNPPGGTSLFLRKLFGSSSVAAVNCQQSLCGGSRIVYHSYSCAAVNNCIGEYEDDEVDNTNGDPCDGLRTKGYATGCNGCQCDNEVCRLEPCFWS